MFAEWILINHCFISSHIGRICDCDWDVDGNDYYDPGHDEISMSINHVQSYDDVHDYYGEKTIEWIIT